MKMKIFITGGTGFLGQEVIKRLSIENFEIKGIARSEKSITKLKKMGVSPVVGNLENIAEWGNELKGQDVVIHCAAPVEFWGKWDKYQKGIVDATKSLFNASEKNGVKQFIFISSESVLQNKKDLVNINEIEPYPKEPNSFYGKSKMLAEKYILNSKTEMNSIIIRPAFIWGKGVKALETIVDKIKSNDFLWINNGRAMFEMVHVKNVAEATFLSVVNGENKKKAIYFVTDDNPQPVKSFLTKLIKTQGIDPPDKNIPKWVALALANLIEWIWKLFKIKSTPMITRFDVAFVAMPRKYTISKIKNDLKYSPIISEKNGLKEMTV